MPMPLSPGFYLSELLYLQIYRVADLTAVQREQLQEMLSRVKGTQKARKRSSFHLPAKLTTDLLTIPDVSITTLQRVGENWEEDCRRALQDESYPQFFETRTEVVEAVNPEEDMCLRFLGEQSKPTFSSVSLHCDWFVVSHGLLSVENSCYGV